MLRVALSVSIVLMLAACSSGRGYYAPHPHGYGHRDSPGRAAPTFLPLPGYDYRFRPDPQGIGRDLPPPWVYGSPPSPVHDDCCAPPPPPCCEADDSYHSEGYVRGGRTHEVYESRSESEAYVYGEAYEALPPVNDYDYRSVPYDNPPPEYAPTPYSSGVIPYEDARPRYEPTPYSSGVIPYEPAPAPTRPAQPPNDTIFY